LGVNLLGPKIPRFRSFWQFVRLIPALLYFFIGLAALYLGHPHEDAYILFQYSRILADTGVITFFEGGTPAEGATDFLWMLAISASAVFGMPPGVSALVLNSLGVWIIASIISKTFKDNGISRIWGFLALSIIPFTLLALPGFGGFSAPLFGGLSLLIFYSLSQLDRNKLWLVPVQGILLGLFRPDGVIIGVLATVVAFFLVHGDQGKKKYIWASISSLFIGVSYFVWRFLYFGNFLPLPLIVKSNADIFLPGAGLIYTWTLTVLPLVILVIIFWLLTLRDKQNLQRIYVALIPFFTHIVSLLFAVPSQNVAYRFYVPETAILIYLTFFFANKLLKSERSIPKFSKRASVVTVIGGVLVSLGAQTPIFAVGYSSIVKPDYIDFFPSRLSKVLDSQTVIASSEAGRLPYWTRGQHWDLVGLNTPEFAAAGVSRMALNNINPDIILLHTAGLWSASCDGIQNFCTLETREDFGVFLGPVKSTDNVRIASREVFEFLRNELESYNVTLVRYAGSYYHVWALKKQSDELATVFETELAASFREMKENPRGYLELEGISYRLNR